MQLFRFEGDRRRTLIYDLLRQWHNTLRSIENAMGVGDLPYVYGERANLGILAVAATKVGYIPFEEYSAEKGRGRNRRSGRADLWLVEKGGAKAFDFEAKYTRVSFHSKRLRKTIKHHLDRAFTDASNIKYKSEYSIGIVFLCPYGAHYKDFDLESFWYQLADLCSYDGDFCSFHTCRSEIWADNKGHKGYPGIAIVGRYLK